jgi:hypothetical protein
MARAKGEGFVCPRCGERGWLERRRVGNNEYFYCHHEYREGGGRRVRTCYLGPREYVYVERTHNLGLAGPLDRDRFRKYFEELLDHFDLDGLKWALRKVGERLEREGLKLSILDLTPFSASPKAPREQRSRLILESLVNLREASKRVVELVRPLRGGEVVVVDKMGRRVGGVLLDVDDAFVRVEYPFGPGRAIASIPLTWVERVEF